MRRIFTLALLSAAFGTSFAQSTADLTIQLNAVTQVSPPSIKLQWKKLTTGTPAYAIYKKAKSSTFWGTPIATLTAVDSTYTDMAVIVDSAYEYEVLASGTSAVPLGGGLPSGYIYAGIKSPAIHNKGAVVLVVDSTYSDSCSAEIKRLMQDISGDGWQIFRHDVARSRKDTFVKGLIMADYAAHPNVKAVLLLGHVAVPYSSLFDATISPPDGHVPQHNGAWPSDVYYSCMTGWTDAGGPDTTGSWTVNWNIPGDGKWDQTIIPSPAVLQVGRIDLYNMPAFSSSDFTLMRRYLSRDHVYKMDSLVMRHRGVLHDDFGYFGGEGFAANAWRNFAPLVGRDSVTSVAANTLITTLAAGTYQWAYGCGGGSFTSAGGIGATTDFVANGDNGIFSMYFGSYFGDWNVQNNFLRAPLCANPPALTNCWAGRPNWFLHHMALGENIGYGTLLTNNNTGSIYQPPNFAGSWIHVALMGDLTLRTDYIKPITNLTITKPFHNGAILNWTASPDPGVIGYYVYRADTAYGNFQLISSMLTATTFHDVSGHSRLHYYMVRPVKLQSTPSGGYYNLGIGVTDTATVSYAGTLAVAGVSPQLGCNVFPNPAKDVLNVTVNASVAGVCTISIVNELGQESNRAVKQLNVGDNTYSLNVSKFAGGIYTVVLKSDDNTVVKKWVKL